MKFSILLTALLLGSVVGNAQGELFTIVEEMPIWKGCDSLPNGMERNNCSDEGLKNYVIQNLNYPSEAKTARQSGTAYVKFEINSKGSVENVKMVRGLMNAPLLNQEALRLVNSIPDYFPGRQRGKAVRVQYTLPIRFQFDENSEKNSPQTIPVKLSRKERRTLKKQKE